MKLKNIVTLHRQNLDQASKELNEFKLFRAEEVSSVAQSEQTTSERRQKEIEIKHLNNNN